MRARSIALGMFAALTAAPVVAESGDADSVNTLEEIVVTAQRRTTDVQKTSVPVTVLTGDDLRKKGIDNVDGLQFSTPSLNVQDSGAGAQPRRRIPRRVLGVRAVFVSLLAV